MRLWLLTSAMGAATLAWGTTVALTYRDMRREIDSLFDAQLAEAARALLQRGAHELHERREHEERSDAGGADGKDGKDGKDDESDDESDDENDDENDDEHDEERHDFGPLLSRHHDYQIQLFFQLWDKDGLIDRSSSAVPTESLASLDDGYETRTLRGSELRVLSLWNKRRTLKAVVAELTTSRAELARRIVMNALAPGALVLPFLLLALGVAVTRALKPLGRLSAEVGRRAPENLAPLAGQSVPAEARPLVAALNALFARLGRALDNERRFTADAAHELRTPLAAIKTQAQVALLARDDAELRHAVSGVVQGVDRATRLVEQLLTLARLDPETSVRGKPVALRPLVADVAAGVGAEAIARNVELALLDGPDVTVTGDEEMLRVLVRNLVDNAVRHSPAGGHVRLSLDRDERAVALVVEDQGPGLTEAQLAQATGRFARVPRAGGGGSGLGLSIVDRVATLHGARLAFGAGAEGKGLRVRVIFATERPSA
jgi:two-component system sensor histidine kinase QseC